MRVRDLIVPSMLLVSSACGSDPSPIAGTSTGGQTPSGGATLGGAVSGGASGGATAGEASSGGGATPSATGGVAGSSTGSTATGGVSASGGSATGSTPGNGGIPSGGTRTGGTSAGGTTMGGGRSGGTNPGGTATGGIRTGGTNAGGVRIGGTNAGGTATGGAPPSPYGHGFVPTTVTRAAASAAYSAWKSIHLEDCGGGRYRVRWENARLDATVSEGIGYGMLLAVSWDERAVFDGLLAYYRAALDTRGLMHWLRYGCDAHREIKYAIEYPDEAAADADLDVAMALLMARCRWSDAQYGTEATRIISAIRTHMFMTDGALRVLQPGDSEWFDTLGNGCVNYSYFAPAYYRAFAQHLPSDAAFWNGAASDAYTLLARASHPTTGLVRNWGSSSGGDASCTSYTRPSSYGDDAARTPWRIATDYLWYGTPAAKTWTDKVTAWVRTVPISATGQWYLRDGALDTLAPGYADHTVINVGPFAVGAMTYDQLTVDAFAAELLAIPSGSGTHDGEYFPRMLRALTLLELAGGFTRCGGK